MVEVNTEFIMLHLAELAVEARALRIRCAELEQQLLAAQQPTPEPEVQHVTTDDVHAALLRRLGEQADSD